MKSHLATAILGAAMLLVPSLGAAQSSAAATAEARARVACGGLVLISAEYLANGLLRVTCSDQRQRPGETTENILTGTGLTIPAGAVVILGVGVIGIIGGGNTPSSSSTTSSTPNPGPSR